ASRIGANTEVKEEEQAPAPADISGTAPIAAGEPVEKPFGFESIFNKPGKSNWSFSEVTENCAALQGVAGALISDSEGLLIAGQWGGEGKADSVAAFIPQMHRRFVEYATELKLGEGENFTFKLENKTFQILKAGKNFLAILGKPGELLPSAQLGAVAKCLAQTVQ
ncbi:MAG: roadblock/LC7 domain-containing protein, partial [Verrucomicrobiota bacterium]